MPRTEPISARPADAQDAFAYDAWFRQQVQIGLTAAQAGELVPAGEVEAEALAWRTGMQNHSADPVK